MMAQRSRPELANGRPRTRIARAAALLAGTVLAAGIADARAQTYALPYGSPFAAGPVPYTALQGGAQGYGQYPQPQPYAAQPYNPYGSGGTAVVGGGGSIIYDRSVLGGGYQAPFYAGVAAQQGFQYAPPAPYGYGTAPAQPAPSGAYGQVGGLLVPGPTTPRSQLYIQPGVAAPGFAQTQVGVASGLIPPPPPPPASSAVGTAAPGPAAVGQTGTATPSIASSGTGTTGSATVPTTRPQVATATPPVPPAVPDIAPPPPPAATGTSDGPSRVPVIVEEASPPPPPPPPPTPATASATPPPAQPTPPPPPPPAAEPEDDRTVADILQPPPPPPTADAPAMTPAVRSDTPPPAPPPPAPPPVDEPPVVAATPEPPAPTPTPPPPPPPADEPPAIAAIEEPAAPTPTPASPPPASTGTATDGSVALSIPFAAGASDLPPASEDELRAIAQQMNADESLRLTIRAYAEGTAEDASQARRLSLSRALAVRSFLIEQGIRGPRMDVRALGHRIEPPRDRVDLVLVSQ